MKPAFTRIVVPLFLVLAAAVLVALGCAQAAGHRSESLSADPRTRRPAGEAAPGYGAGLPSGTAAEGDAEQRARDVTASAPRAEPVRPDPGTKIPYDDILRYPTDWPADREVRGDQPAAQGGLPATAAPENTTGSDRVHPSDVMTRPGGGGFGGGGGYGGKGAAGSTSSRPDRRLAPFGSPGGGRQQRPRGAGLVPPESLPAPDEELWVIATPDAPPQAREIDGNPIPGSGLLVATPPGGGDRLVPVPLKHTDVKAGIAGYVATVDVKQQFHNPYDGKIEAVYVFPLPANAAVNEFVMTVGERRIRGIIREREEATRIYNEARGAGHVASLLTQERPNVFTQKVANIEPGKAIDIDVRYFHTLSYNDGWYEFVFPMVVGPRFNPPGTAGGVGSVGDGNGGTSGQATEVQYLRPQERSGHDIALSVSLDAGVRIEDLKSLNHKVRTTDADGGNKVTVQLDPAESLPNQDFVLRYKVAGDRTKGALIAQKDEKGQGYFTLMLVPPENLGSLPPRPLEMVFTLDVSGSMNGAPINQSKAAMRYALAHMGPQDTFQIVQFAGHAAAMAQQPLPATPENVRAALAYMEQTQAGGGTMMLEGIRASLNIPPDENRLRFVSFLTDGYIGNEAEILRAVQASLGPARVFSFGVGNAPNRYLLDGLAKQGRGAVAYLGLNDDATEVMARFYERIRRPALTDVEIDWGGMRVSEVFPAHVPDLFVGRPVVLTGKFSGELADRVRVRGRLGNEVQTVELPVATDGPAVERKALPAVWARMKIADLADEAAMAGGADVAGQVRQIALEHGLMSSFTSFVAVDSSAKTQGTFGTTVAVPVPVPAGVRYETAVQNGPGNGAGPGEGGAKAE